MDFREFSVLLVIGLVGYFGVTKLVGLLQRRKERKIVLEYLYGLPVEIKLILAFYRIRKAHTLNFITNDERLVFLRHNDLISIQGQLGDGTHAYFTLAKKVRPAMAKWAETDFEFPGLVKRINDNTSCLPL
jgi:hypothetical protein